MKTDAGDELTAGFDTWTKYRRVKVDEHVRQEEVGSMSQLPLRLGWAITIHKSWGMTLDNVVFNAPRSLSAPGQAYVGLSRARSFDRLLCAARWPGGDILLSEDAVAYRSLLLPLSLEFAAKSHPLPKGAWRPVGGSRILRIFCPLAWCGWEVLG